MNSPRKQRLFGTDGIRGVAGDEVDAELALTLGRAAALAMPAARPQVVIARDTRESGPMLEAALAAGIAAGGGDAWLAGVLPTPAASVLVRRLGLDLAAVVSASHNPWQDNGIKLFGPEGGKISEELQSEIERLMAAPEAAGQARAGRINTIEGALGDYLRELRSAFALDLAGRRVVLDCANGATYRAAPAVFEHFGATVDAMAVEPDGRNINAGCGSTDPAALAARVKDSGAEIGFAFDGDGDRVIAVDAGGEVRDGDELIAVLATGLAAAGELGGGVAVTVMSNFGFHRAMEAAGVEVATTPVGDRHVSAELERRGWRLGGEQSGHIIWTEMGPTGDGIAAALLTLRALGDRPLAGAVPMQKLPQRLVNVRVRDLEALEGSTAVAEAVAREAEALDGRGRVLLRPSGTEPLVRVMVEAPAPDECEAVAARLAEVVERELA
jgi:phosphoglucosamine mutase